MRLEVLTAGLSVAAYLAGSIPSGLLVGKALTGRDVRDVGSGNIGAANVSRLTGLRGAMIVLALDIAKGVAPVWVGRILGLGPAELALVGGVAVVGHDFSVFLRLRGGKGVATSLGVVAVLALPAALAAAAVWLTVVAVTRYSSLASLIALWCLPPAVAAVDAPAPYLPLTVGLALLATLTHRSNIDRLASGRERRIGSGAGA